MLWKEKQEQHALWTDGNYQETFMIDLEQVAKDTQHCTLHTAHCL